MVNYKWLVVEPTPLKNMSSSVGMMKFPIYGNIKFMFQTTNQINELWMAIFSMTNRIINSTSFLLGVCDIHFRHLLDCHRNRRPFWNNSPNASEVATVVDFLKTLGGPRPEVRPTQMLETPTVRAFSNYNWLRRLHLSYPKDIWYIHIWIISP